MFFRKLILSVTIFLCSLGLTLFMDTQALNASDPPEEEMITLPLDEENTISMSLQFAPGWRVGRGIWQGSVSFHQR